MISEVIAIASAWALFAIVHSLTITDRFQIGCRSVFGKRRFDAWHRLAYTFVSIGSFLTLIAYLRTLNDRSLYSLTGFPRAALRLVQLGALVFLLKTPLSILDFLGVRSVLAPPRLSTDRTYRLVRHPLYLGGAAILVFQPDQTLVSAVSTVMAILYFYLGSFHEESRLVTEFGDAYRRYQRRVPRLFPIRFRRK